MDCRPPNPRTTSLPIFAPRDQLEITVEFAPPFPSNIYQAFPSVDDFDLSARVVPGSRTPSRCKVLVRNMTDQAIPADIELIVTALAP